MPQYPLNQKEIYICLGVIACFLFALLWAHPAVAVVGLIALGFFYAYCRKRRSRQKEELYSYLAEMVMTIEDTSSYAVRNLSMAILLVDRAGTLLWSNPLLDTFLGVKVTAGEKMSVLWPELPLSDINDESGQLTIRKDDKTLRVTYRRINEHKEHKELYAIYVADCTEEDCILKDYADRMPVFSYIQIDNYDDVLQGLTERQRSMLLLEVGKILTEWVAGLNGFLRKYTEDTYVALFSEEGLQRSMKDKFAVLDKVRAVHRNNRIPITISVGVASGKMSIAELADTAQAGLDLALGRGGDQIAVNIGGKVEFYGGKTKAVEKHTRVKARVVAHAIYEMMQKASSILIMGHQHEDFDCLGAAVGVAKMGQQLGKPVHIIVSGDNPTVLKMKEIMRGQMEETLQSDAQADLFVAEQPKLFITEEEAMPLLFGSVVFVVDTHRPSRVAAPKLLSCAEKVVVIDHHRRSEDFIVKPFLVYLEPAASSTCELVTELIEYFGADITLTKAEATALYAGIVLDTKNFAVQTGVRTFDAASYLRRSGAEPFSVRELFRTDYQTVKTRSDILSRAEVIDEIMVGICPVENNLPTANIQALAGQTADMMLMIDGVAVSYVLFSLADGGVGISARSDGSVNVQVVMEQMGGGGHQTVAGAQVKDKSIAAVREEVIARTRQAIKESVVNESNLIAGC